MEHTKYLDSEDQIPSYIKHNGVFDEDGSLVKGYSKSICSNTTKNTNFGNRLIDLGRMMSEIYSPWVPKPFNMEAALERIKTFDAHEIKALNKRKHFWKKHDTNRRNSSLS